MTAFREGISQILGLADEDKSGAHWVWEGLYGVNRQPSNGSESNRQPSKMEFSLIVNRELNQA